MKKTVCQTHNSDHYDELLTVYASGNSSQEERQRVEKLLAQCAGCRHKVMELEQTWWALDVWEEDERQVPLRLNNFRARLAEVKNEQPAWKRAYEQIAFFFRPAQLMPAMSMAAVIIAAMVIMVQPNGFWQNNTDSNPILSQENSSNAADDSQALITQQNSVQATVVSNTVPVAANGLEVLSREDRFDMAVKNSKLNPQENRFMQNRKQYLQTAGFSPSKHFVTSFDAMDGNVQLNPGYIPNTHQ
jgi:anti-sigma factor RsiW